MMIFACVGYPDLLIYLVFCWAADFIKTLYPGYIMSAMYLFVVNRLLRTGHPLTTISCVSYLKL